jgi:DNA polymerase-1
MMRIASILAVERDIKLCNPVHDALLIEARSDQIDSEVVRLKECMSEASQAFLGAGKVCRIDAVIIRHPVCCMDEHGHQMWDQIINLIEEIQR